MSEVTGFMWQRPLLEVSKSGYNVVISLKGNGEDEFEGKVDTVNGGIVTLVDDNATDEVCVYVLLDEIAAVVVEKGDD